MEQGKYGHLYKDTEYADLVISCGEYRFKVHRPVLGPQSNFFRRVTGNHQDNHRVVEIRNCDPVTPHRVIEFAYLGDHNHDEKSIIPDAGIDPATSASSHIRDFDEMITLSLPPTHQHLDAALVRQTTTQPQGQELVPFRSRSHDNDIVYTVSGVDIVELDRALAGINPPQKVADAWLHLKMYDIAVRFGMQALQDLAIDRFKSILARIWREHGFTELTRNVFALCSPNTNDVACSTHVTCKLVAQECAERLSYLVEDMEFDKELRFNARLAYLIIHSTVDAAKVDATPRDDPSSDTKDDARFLTLRVENQQLRARLAVLEQDALSKRAEADQEIDRQLDDHEEDILQFQDGLKHADADALANFRYTIEQQDLKIKDQEETIATLQKQETVAQKKVADQRDSIHGLQEKIKKMSFAASDAGLAKLQGELVAAKELNSTLKSKMSKQNCEHATAMQRLQARHKLLLEAHQRAAAAIPPAGPRTFVERTSAGLGRRSDNVRSTTGGWPTGPSATKATTIASSSATTATVTSTASPVPPRPRAMPLGGPPDRAQGGGSGGSGGGSTPPPDARVRAYNEALRLAGQEFKSCLGCGINFNAQFRGVTEDPRCGFLALRCADCNEECCRWDV